MSAQNYTVMKQTDTFFIIEDERHDRAYFLIGKERALLIDTCMSDTPLLPVLRSLTDRPIDLALTHAHIDHMYRCSEFDRVYVYEKEKDAFSAKAQRLMDFGAVVFRVKRKKYPVHTFLPLSESESIDLGGVQLFCRGFSGHTKGSAVFIDETHRAVFCGDAVGSGSGVWMFLPDSTALPEYSAALKNAAEYLRPYQDYQYFGGHGEQESADGAPPFGYQTVCDMYTLCEALQQKNTQGVFTKKLRFLPLLYAKQGTAALAVTTKKIHIKGNSNA